jgi:hypothetical protein
MKVARDCAPGEHSGRCSAIQTDTASMGTPLHYRVEELMAFHRA